jgi:transposase
MPEDGMGLDVESDGERVSGFAGRLEVIEGPSGRRSWPDVVKAQIVRESFEPGVTVSEVARRHRMSPQHLTSWRRAAQEGRLTLAADRDDNGGGGGFVPLAIDAGRIETTPFVDERISVEVNGVVLKLSAETRASRIAEIVSALEARR